MLCQDEHDEAEQVTQQLKTAHTKGGYDWNAMAIFYRMNSLFAVRDGRRPSPRRAACRT